MKYCKECGSKLGEGSKICNNCGAILLVTESTSNLEQKFVSETVSKEPMSRKKKVSLIIAGIAIILLFSLYKVGATLTSKDRLIDKFQTAINNKDAKAVAKLISSYDKKLEINEKSVKGFIEIFNKDPEKLSVVVKSLKEQSQILEKSSLSKKGTIQDFLGIASDVIDNGIVTLTQDGNFLFYKKYTLKINPVYVTLSTNYKDTDLYIDGTKVGKSNNQDFEQTYGPFVPGFHKLEAKYKNSLVSLDKKNTVLFGRLGTKQSEDLTLDGRNVSFNLSDYGSLDKVELFINGKDTGVNLVKEDAFGPVLTDGSMTYSVQAALPFGEVKTKEEPIDNNEISINLLSNDVTKTLMDTCVKNEEEWIVAFTNGDYSKMTTGSPTYIQSQKAYYDQEKSNNHAFQGKYLGSLFDTSQFHLFQEDGVWKAEVLVREKYYISYYSIGNTPNLQDKNDDWVYTLVYDSDKGKWIVDNYNKDDSFDEANTTEIKEENPKLYTSDWASSGKSN